MELEALETTTNFKVPEPPDHSMALEEIPETVQEQWREIYTAAYKEATEENPPQNATDLITLRNIALGVANKKLIRVKPPKSFEDGMAIPKWQLLLREEVPYEKLPKHAIDEIKAAKGRKSGNYLRVYTTDGREYFFAVPPDQK